MIFRLSGSPSTTRTFWPTGTSVAQLIEDDLLLSLPGRGCEVFDECPRRPVLAYPAPGTATGSEALDRTGQEKQNPFAVLAELKRRDD